LEPKPLKSILEAEPELQKFEFRAGAGAENILKPETPNFDGGAGAAPK